MIEIGRTLISDDVVEKKFVCDLHACKGACCVHGDSGAPLEKEETEILEKIYDKVKPYLTEKGIAAIEKQGTWLKDSDGDKVTPLVNGNKECAYTVFENGMALCGIEMAWKDGKIKWQKPISCHLYPVRITAHKSFDAVNYEKWNICKPACACGEKLEVPVYKFVKTALVRKYGSEWFEQLEAAAEFVANKK
ncbi:MAG: DUF3109 family protein [Bacteroidetes bacterium]|nr:DUF3109 family protein [Bacteroidota bacterium]